MIHVVVDSDAEDRGGTESVVEGQPSMINKHSMTGTGIRNGCRSNRELISPSRELSRWRSESRFSTGFGAPLVPRCMPVCMPEKKRYRAAGKPLTAAPVSRD